MLEPLRISRLCLGYERKLLILGCHLPSGWEANFFIAGLLRALNNTLNNIHWELPPKDKTISIFQTSVTMDLLFVIQVFHETHWEILV